MSNPDLHPGRHVSLCDALDRLLQTGVMAMGEVMLSVADVDMVCVRVQLVISAVDSLRTTAPELVPANPPRYATTSPSADAIACEAARSDAEVLAPAIAEAPGARVATDAAAPGRDAKSAQALGKLVLTVIKLLHDLLERQALHRIEAGTLSSEQIERLGMTLMRQANEIERLRKEFGLEGEELNLDLGPLGKLI